MFIKVIIDHKSLEYLMTTKILTRYQVCKVKFLLKLNFIIFYTMSKNNAKANTLIQCPNKNPTNYYNN